MLTVSKALDMSRATDTVLSGGCGLLKPCVIMLFMACSAVVVECLALKPCWCCCVVMLGVMYLFNIIFSSVLAMGESSDMGL